MTLGVYQVKLVRSYAQEHCDTDGSYRIFVSTEVPMDSFEKLKKKETCFRLTLQTMDQT